MTLYEYTCKLQAAAEDVCKLRPRRGEGFMQNLYYNRAVVKLHEVTQEGREILGDVEERELEARLEF